MMTFFTRSRRWLALLAVAVAVTFTAVDFAEARRGGSFGSRGSRTFSTPAPTPTAPRTVAPVERSMTPRTDQNTNPVRTPGVQQAQRPGGFFGGFGGGILGGLLAGGLLGMMFGGGFGGAAGFLGLIVQVAIIALIAMLLMRFFRGRSQQPAYAGGPSMRERMEEPLRDLRGQPRAGSVPPVAPKSQDDVGIGADDLDAFEQLLAEVQDAYGREDFAALRARTTPEVMGYLAEELGQNGARGVKNEVSQVRLLQGDLSEAWREGSLEYATVAMRYESLDVTRERATGRVVEGDPDRPTETTELWTFVRERGGNWRLSAIQAA